MQADVISTDNNTQLQTAAVAVVQPETLEAMPPAVSEPAHTVARVSGPSETPDMAPIAMPEANSPVTTEPGPFATLDAEPTSAALGSEPSVLLGAEPPAATSAQAFAPQPSRVAGLIPRAFWTQKSGNAETDYEDGWAAGADCLAIADGATESSFARVWAQALTAGFVAQPHATFPLHTERPEQCRARIQEWTQPLQAEWHSLIPWNTLPWFAEDKARAGAFATLLTFQIQEKEKRRKGEEESEDSGLSTLVYQHSTWQAFAIGDSCLFQIRDGRIKLAFPLEEASQFDSTPLLLSSNPVNNKRVWNEIAIAEGTFQAGDILLFATDALARWFLVEVEAGNMPWHELCGLGGQADFEAFVARLRQVHAMRNDDVTLMIVDASHLPLLPPEGTLPSAVEMNAQAKEEQA